MTVGAGLTDESGQSLTIRLAQFLRQEFGVIGAGGWPRNPPNVISFIEAAQAPGTPRHRLGAIVSDVSQVNGRPMCLGIVDLDIPRDAATGSYTFAGWGLDSQSTVGSSAKVWAMYAAFQLRYDVRAFVQDTPGIARSNIEGQLKEAWRNSPIPELKRVARQGRMPRLGSIFDLSALPADPGAAAAARALDPNAIDFAGIADCGVPPGFVTTAATEMLAAALDTFHEHEYSDVAADKIDMWEQLAAMPFGHRLWLTTAWSDNAAATTCATDIGLDYIDSLCTGARLYDADRNLGARLAQTYGSPAALLDARTWPSGSPLFQRLSQFRGQPKGAAPRQAATVRTFLAFVASLDARELISAADSNQMLSLMRPPKLATGPLGQAQIAEAVSSFILSAFEEFVDDSDVGLHVAEADHPFEDAVAKIGIVNNRLADAAIVTIVTNHGRRLHWGVAFLANESPTGDSQFDLAANQYGRALKEVVRRWLDVDTT